MHPALVRIARIVHEADLDDERFDAPEAPGFDVIFRALSVVRADDDVVDLGAALFDALYAYLRRRDAATAWLEAPEGGER